LDESVAEQLTEVVPIGKLDPDGGLHVIVTGLQLSAAVGAKLTIASLLPGPAVTVMLAGLTRPLLPNVVSTVPFELYRTSMKSFPSVPAAMILPSDWIAAARATSFAPGNARVNLPPVPKEESRSPLAARTSLKETDKMRTAARAEAKTARPRVFPIRRVFNPVRTIIIFCFACLASTAKNAWPP